MWAIGDMCHHVIGGKSTIKDKWIGRKFKKPMRNGHVASEMTSHLTTIFSQPVWEEGKRERYGERKGRKGFRKRVSTFSLDFPVIGPANFGEVRSKVGLCYKGYAWVLVLWSFGNSER